MEELHTMPLTKIVEEAYNEFGCVIVQSNFELKMGQIIREIHGKPLSQPIVIVDKATRLDWVKQKIRAKEILGDNTPLKIPSADHFYYKAITD